MVSPSFRGVVSRWSGSVYTPDHNITLPQDMFLPILSSGLWVQLGKRKQVIPSTCPNECPLNATVLQTVQGSAVVTSQIQVHLRIYLGQARMTKVMLGTDQIKTPDLTNSSCSLSAGMGWAWDKSRQLSQLGWRASSSRIWGIDRARNATDMCRQKENKGVRKQQRSS